MPDSTHPYVQPEEAIAVAMEFGRSTDGLVGIKLPPGEGWEILGDQDLDGFTAKEFLLSWPYRGGGSTERPAVRYDSPHGSLIVVAHESGTAIWAVVEQAANVVEVVGGIGGLIALWRASRGSGDVPKPDKVTADSDGNLVSVPWDERNL